MSPLTADGVVPASPLDAIALGGVPGDDAPVEATINALGSADVGVLWSPASFWLFTAFATKYAPEPSRSAPRTSGVTRRTRAHPGFGAVHARDDAQRAAIVRRVRERSVVVGRGGDGVAMPWHATELTEPPDEALLVLGSPALGIVEVRFELGPRCGHSKARELGRERSRISSALA